MFRKQMKKFILAAFTLFIFQPQLVKAEGVYLILKSRIYNRGVSIHAIPMSSMESCESAGVKIISSDRFDLGEFAKGDAFECILK
tara:strand:- start:601 stop:855 length:255 start_codon:yes stop_codon:yes gene_type:complete